MAAKKKPMKKLTKKPSKKPAEKPSKKQDAERRPRTPLQRRAPSGEEPSMTAEIPDDAVFTLPYNNISSHSPATIVTPLSDSRLLIFYEYTHHLINCMESKNPFDADRNEYGILKWMYHLNVIGDDEGVRTDAAPSALLIEDKIAKTNTVYVVYKQQATSGGDAPIEVFKGDIVEGDIVVNQCFRSQFADLVRTSIGPCAFWLFGELHVAYNSVSDDNRVYLARLPKRAAADWKPTEIGPFPPKSRKT
jgi:hypothetical protein